ncbi:MAG: DUF433 domain-containing protein [Gemmatimonadota bacterium]
MAGHRALPVGWGWPSAPHLLRRPPAVGSPRPSRLYDILEYLASGMTEDQILADFPDLEPEDIRAALAFAA